MLFRTKVFYTEEFEHLDILRKLLPFHQDHKTLAVRSRNGAVAVFGPVSISRLKNRSRVSGASLFALSQQIEPSLLTDPYEPY